MSVLFLAGYAQVGLDAVIEMLKSATKRLRHNSRWAWLR